MADARKSFSSAGWAFVAFEVGTLLGKVLIAFIIVLGEARLGWDLSDWQEFCVQDFFRYLTSVPLYYLVFRSVPSCPPKKETWSFKKLVLTMIMLYGLIEVGGIIGNLLMFLINGVSSNPSQNGLVELLNTLPIPAIFLCVVVAAPVIEELVFRKWLLDRVGRFGERTAVLLSAVVFGLAHGNFYQFFYAFAAGGVFAYIYMRTGKIQYTIGFHMVVNFLGSIIPMLMLDEIFSGAAKSGTLLAMVLYASAVLGVAAAGCTLLIGWRKRLKWVAAEQEMPAGQRLKTVWRNPGMIACSVVLLAIFVLNLVF